jgi:hypothetical protein
MHPQAFLIGLMIVLSVVGCSPKAIPDKSKFAGRWYYDYRKATVDIHEDGRLEMVWTNTTYKGKWFVPDDQHLVLRVVVPLHRPDIDDDLNAEEMCFSLKEVTDDKIIASQFDEEGIHTFTRIKEAR